MRHLAVMRLRLALPFLCVLAHSLAGSGEVAMGRDELPPGLPKDA